MTLDQAKTHTRNGAIAALVSSVMTILVVIVAISTDASDSMLAAWNDPLNFVDVLLILGCAVGMYRHSRAASVFAFVYFLFAKIYIALDSGSFTGLPAGLIFLYFFGRAIQGSFAYHRIRKEEDPDYRPAKKLAFIIGIPLGAIFLVLMAVGLLSTGQFIPATRVVMGDEVLTSDIELLANNNVLLESEEVVMLYSYGFVSVLEGGSVLTDRAVVTYHSDESGQVQVYAIEFGDIESIDLIEQGDWYAPSIYQVNGYGEGEWLVLELSAEEKGDESFIAALKDRINALPTTD